jgi:hypothetical protein
MYMVFHVLASARQHAASWAIQAPRAMTAIKEKSAK